MRLLSRILLSTAALAVLPLSSSLAADYDPPIYIEEAPQEVPVEIGSGWYLRGDIGYAFRTRAKTPFEYRTYDGLTGTYGQSAFATGELESDFTWGGGFGYHFSDWLRADATIEGFQGNFRGTTASAFPCLPAPEYVGTGCRSEDNADYNALSLMANGYVDLGTFVGFTPYVGGGAGFTLMRWGPLTNDLYCATGVAPCPDPDAHILTATHGGDRDWRFTYALMAGFAYDINDVLKVDVGYKYRHVDGGSMFGFDQASIAAGATGIQGTDKGFDQHEIRVGLRYELW